MQRLSTLKFRKQRVFKLGTRGPHLKCFCHYFWPLIVIPFFKEESWDWYRGLFSHFHCIHGPFQGFKNMLKKILKVTYLIKRFLCSVLCFYPQYTSYTGVKIPQFNFCFWALIQSVTRIIVTHTVTHTINSERENKLLTDSWENTSIPALEDEEWSTFQF